MSTDDRRCSVAPIIATVQIPACQDHGGWATVTVSLLCRLACDGWRNPCGHVDLYKNVRTEAGLR
jgi:hypothetical protein